MRASAVPYVRSADGRTQGISFRHLLRLLVGAAAGSAGRLVFAGGIAARGAVAGHVHHRRDGLGLGAVELNLNLLRLPEFVTSEPEFKAFARDVKIVWLK